MKKKSIIVILLVMILAYPVWRIHDAKTRINDFSQQISEGMSLEAIELLSRKMNLKTSKTAANDSGAVILIARDGWAFARWSCVAVFENNKLVNKKVMFID